LPGVLKDDSITDSTSSAYDVRGRVEQLDGASAKVDSAG